MNSITVPATGIIAFPNSGTACTFPPDNTGESTTEMVVLSRTFLFRENPSGSNDILKESGDCDEALEVSLTTTNRVMLQPGEMVTLSRAVSKSRVKRPFSSVRSDRI